MYSVPKRHKLGLFRDAGMLRRVVCQVRGRRNYQQLSLNDFLKKVLGYGTCSTSPVDEVQYGCRGTSRCPEGYLYQYTCVSAHWGQSELRPDTSFTLFFLLNKERALSPFFSLRKVNFGARRATPHADETGDRVR